MTNSFGTQQALDVNGKHYEIHSVAALKGRHDVDRLPYSLKILLENLLRTEDGENVTREHIEALLNWQPKAEPDTEIAFTPARVVMQDFTGVPAIVDLAAMRDAMGRLGGDPKKINPLSPAELVIDHSVMVDFFGSKDAPQKNAQIEFERNGERYVFLRWGQNAFSNFKVVPPDTGIVHQVNIEYLASVVFSRTENGVLRAYPDTVVGTDSHTTMVNGLGVLGWGVGGIEAEAAMLGQPISMLIPQVVGFRLTGKLPEGATATDLVLTVTQMLRKKGVVGKFVEFFGDGLDNLPLADRATIGNMAPEYGATCGIFPIDKEVITYLRLTGRSDETLALVEAYARATGLWREKGQRDAEYSDVLELDMGKVVPSLAGPRRPQDRVDLSDAPNAFATYAKSYAEELAAKGKQRAADGVEIDYRGQRFKLVDGAVVIAAITSCTNTSNPAVLMAAGLVAKKAHERGLTVKPWVKTSLAPGSQAVPSYLRSAGLLEHLEALNFHVTAFGCTTCIGNSGPLADVVSDAINRGNLAVAAVLSGNRNFEGRINGDVRTNWLASPPLVVAYAIAGNMNVNLAKDSLGKDKNGKDVYLKDIWPTQAEIAEAVTKHVHRKGFLDSYADVFKGDHNWQGLKVPTGDIYSWPQSSYIANPPYFDGMTMKERGLPEIKDARVLVYVGDSITTDHISPAGSFKPDTPAGKYLQSLGVAPKDFNSYGSRRGNHEVMMRGTFANVRLKNKMAPGTEGGWTTHQPSGEQTSIYDAAMKYKAEQVPLVVLAGKEYGTGSSRDWAAKGTMLLGVQVVIAESYERIHRSNLVGMGVLPLQFKPGESAESLGLTGKETFSVGSLTSKPRQVKVTAKAPDGKTTEFEALVRIDTPNEWEYYRNGGILHFVLRNLARKAA